MYTSSKHKIDTYIRLITAHLLAILFSKSYILKITIYILLAIIEM